MAVARMLFAVLLCATSLSKHVLGSCQWSGWGTCCPPFFLRDVSPTAALEYAAIINDISKTNSEKKAALEAWASNQNPVVQDALNAYWEQRIANVAAAKERRAELAAYLSPEAQTLNAQLLAIADDESLTQASRSAKVSELMNAASIAARIEILLLESQLAFIGTFGNPRVAQQSFADETAAIVAKESPSDSTLADAKEVANEISSSVIPQVSSEANGIWNAMADSAANKEAIDETLTDDIAATANMTVAVAETVSIVPSEASASENVDTAVASASANGNVEKTIMKRAAKGLLNSESSVQESNGIVAEEATADTSASNKELSDSGDAVGNNVKAGVPEEVVNDTALAKAVAAPAIVDAADIDHWSERVITINVTVEDESNKVANNSKVTAAVPTQELADGATSNGSRTENNTVIEKALDDVTKVADAITNELSGRNGDTMLDVTDSELLDDTIGNSRRSLVSKKTHISPIVSTLTMFTSMNRLSPTRLRASASAD